jgi:hypothetical protein
MATALTLSREKSYDSTYTGNTEGTEYIDLRETRPLLDALEQLTPGQKKAIDMYQIVPHCDMIHAALDTGNVEEYTRIANKITSDIDDSYSGNDKYIFDNIKRNYNLDIPNYADTIRDLDSVFDAIPSINTPLFVYRCYANWVTENRLDRFLFNPANPTNNKRYISTSLSFKMVTSWCQEGDSKLRICIYIPPSSKVLPILYFKFKNVKQNEMLLPRTAVFKNTKLVHPTHNIPIYVYVPTYDIPIDEHIQDIRRFLSIAPLVEETPAPVASIPTKQPSRQPRPRVAHSRQQPYKNYLRSQSQDDTVTGTLKSQPLFGSTFGGKTKKNIRKR